MSAQKKELTPIEEIMAKGHKVPKTRRQFLAHGLVSGVSTAVLPTFLTMLTRTNIAFAEQIDCAEAVFKEGLPYVCIDVAGGCNIAGSNAMVSMVKDSRVQDDASSSSPGDYIRLGITPEEAPSNSGKVETKYGLHFHRASGFLDGMRKILEPLGEELKMPNGRPISDGVDGLIFCTRTADDSATNPINTVFQANRAGAKGKLVQLVGNSGTATGARSSAPASQIDSKLRPTQINNYNGAKGLLSLGNKLTGEGAGYFYQTGVEGTDAKDTERVKSFMNRISKMNSAKINEIKKMGSTEQIANVLKCSSNDAKNLFDKYSASALDPANDMAISTIYGGDQAQGAVAKLVLDNIAGAGTITIGGGDYHGNPAMTTHNTDVNVGRAIGRLIRTAMEKGKNLVIHVYTDGGVAGDSGGATEPVVVEGIGEVAKVRWTGDSGTRSSAIMIVYKHNHDGTPLVKKNASNVPERQVGGFVKAGGVDQNSIIGNSTENLWKAIMINYLAAQGYDTEAASFRDEFKAIFKSDLPDKYEELVRMLPVQEVA